MSSHQPEQLAAIAQEIAVCRACRLFENATNPVPGYGDASADILFIGEGPGHNEDQQGLPFVGRSGRYLDYLLELIGLERSQVFITNVVKHRPPDNRDPSPDEILACKGFLDRQIAIIDPLVIATLGRFSMARYFPDARISRIHGEPRYDGDRAYYPLYHPAAALRNPNLRHDMEADIRRLPEIVAEVRRRREAVAGSTHRPPEPPPPAPDDDQDDQPPQQLKLF